MSECVFRYNGQHNLCRAWKCTSSSTCSENATAASVCSRYGNANIVLLVVIMVCVELCINLCFFFCTAPEKLRSMTAKTFTTPLPSGRKAFGAVNKKVSTPAVNLQEKKLLKPQVRINYNGYEKSNVRLCHVFIYTSYNTCTNVIFCLPQETKVKQAACTKVEEYPEIEKFIPYDPLGNDDISCMITFLFWDLKMNRCLIRNDLFCLKHISFASMSPLMVYPLRTRPICQTLCSIETED